MGPVLSNCEYGCIVPVDGMVQFVTMFGGSRLNIANGINIVVEAVTCLVFFDSLDKRAASLSDVKVAAMFTGYLVYCVARAMLRSRRLVGVEYGHQSGGVRKRW